jgi:negative regulator of sigma E activity
MKYRFAVMLVSVLSTAPVLAAGTGPDLLIKMNNALHRMNYSGTLVHIKGNDVNTLRVEHEVVNGVENETVTSLNDSSDSVSSQSQGFSLAMVPDSIEQMRNVYSLDVGAMKKVAKRDCQIVVARPKDKMRYLQKYCIDKSTGLPLAYSLIDNKHQTVERFTFTDVKISLADNADTSTSTVSPPQTWIPDTIPSGDWSITELPKGFHFGQHLASQQAEIEKGPNTEHFVLTDGLSSISVFISPITTAKPKSASSLSSGALNVLTSQKNNHRITLVGEVPRATMQDILTNLKYIGKP